MKSNLHFSTLYSDYPKEEIAPFTIEEGLALKPHTSLNIINYGNQYARFIGELPKY